jgi:integrase
MGDATIYKHPRTPYWQAHFLVWDSAHQRWKAKTASTRCKDEAKALEIAREFERLSLVASGQSGQTRVTRDFTMNVLNDILRISGHREVQDTKSWKEYSERWLAAMARKVPQSLSKSSLELYKGHVKKFTAFLGKDATLPINFVTTEKIQDWYLAGSANGLSATTLNSDLRTIHTIFKRCLAEGYISLNPCALIDRETQTGNKRTDFTSDEIKTITDYLQGQRGMEDWLTVWLLGLCTSQRLSDCANASRAHFLVQPDFWIWELTPKKTSRFKKKLRVPIVEPLAGHLRELWKRPSDSLFLAPSLEGRLTSNLSKAFGKILDDAGVSRGMQVKSGAGQNFAAKSFHSTRHTCNSLLANAGVPMDIRRAITGHADDVTNMIYTHFSDEKKQEALASAFKF